MEVVLEQRVGDRRPLPVRSDDSDGLVRNDGVGRHRVGCPVPERGAQIECGFLPLRAVDGIGLRDLYSVLLE